MKHSLEARALYRLRVLLLAVVAVLVASGCTLSRNPVTGRKAPLGYTWAQERQLGQQADREIVAQFGVYDDPEMQAYVERIGKEVLAESHMRRPETAEEFRNTPFTFRVLDSPVVNAFALPGGYVYVTRGLLTHLQNEAQLAVVLGHEIAHVAARHAAERAFRAQVAQVGLIGGAILGQEVLGLPAGDVLDIGSTAAQLLFLSYSRSDERESDQLGVEYAALAGYQAREGAAFFRSLKRLQAQQGQGLPSFLSTHPDPGEREQTIPRLAAEWEARAQMTRVGQEALYDQLAGAVLGENPRHGFTEGGTFYHPDLRFRFPVPGDFLVQNQPQQVAMIERNQQAVVVLTLAQQSSARQAAATLAGQQGIQVIENSSTRVNGLSAHYVLAAAQTQQGQDVRLLSYFIEHGGRVYSFLGYSAAQQFSRYQDVFLRTMRGFAPLTDSRILNVQPARVDIQRASRTAPFSAFVPQQLPFGMTAEELAILNQVRLDEQIPQGQLLKLPQQ